MPACNRVRAGRCSVGLMSFHGVFLGGASFGVDSQWVLRMRGMVPIWQARLPGEKKAPLGVLFAVLGFFNV